MAPCLAHKKSRRGCYRCKTRKVKCNEAYPTCAGCARHRVSCVYPSDSSVPKNSSSPSIASTEASTIPNHLSIGSPYSHEGLDGISSDSLSILGMILAQNYTEMISQSFPSDLDPVTGKRHSQESLHTAYDHPFLLHALFALSALHMALVPTKRKGIESSFDYALLHRFYLNLAVQETRLELNNITKANAKALALASPMMNMMSIRLLPDQTANEPYSPPVQWLVMSSSIRMMIQATMPLLQGDSMLDFFKNTGGPDWRVEADVYDYTYNEPLRSLLNFNDGVEIMDNERLRLYDQALAYVYKVHSAVEEGEPHGKLCRRVMGLGPMVNVKFIDMISERRPRALAILAHHIVMSKLLESSWWMVGIAEREIHGIRDIVPDNWKWALEWPVQTLATFTARVSEPILRTGPATV